MKDTYIKALFATAIVVVCAIAAFLVHGDRQKRAQFRDIAALVSAGTEQLRQAFEKGAGPDDLARASANLEALRAMDAARQRPLAEAAEQYLTSVRAIVRRRGETAQLARRAAADRQTLVAHMGTRRNDAWFARAIDLKKQVEKDHYELALAFKAMDDVFFSLPEESKRLAPLAGADALLDDATRIAARKRFQDEADRAVAQLNEVRRMPDR